MAFVLALAAPLAIGLLRHPDVWFLPLIAGFPALALLGSDRQARPAYAACFVGCVWVLALPGLLAAAGPRYYAFYCTLAALLFLGLFPPAARHPVSKGAFGALLLVVALLALGCADYARAAGILPGRGAFLTVFQTNRGEVVAYVAQFVQPLTIGAICVLPVLLAVLLAKAGRPRPRLPGRLQPLAFGLVGVVLWQTSDASNEARLLSAFTSYQQMRQAYREAAARRRTPGHQIEARQTRAGAALHVVVIGESTSRNHMGLYGYPRDTTPKLSAMADALVVFTDAISSHSHTLRVLPQALTLADLDNGIEFADPRAYSVIEILNAAGVTTWWLSNQKPMGIWDDEVTMLAAAADHLEFMSRGMGRRSSPGFDGRLLPAFRRAVRAVDQGPDQTAVIFVQLIGTHWPYHQRYPDRFARFAGPLSRAAFGALELPPEVAANVNHYDNAVLYGDHVLSRLIRILRAEGPPAASLLYFSDHGESPLEGTGHDAARFGRGHVEIPLLFWFSDAFAERQPELVRTLAANRHERFMTDELEDLVLDLVGIETEVFEPTRSPFRAGFEVPRRLIMEAQIDYDRHDDALLNAKRNLQALRERRPELYRKAWAHRVDSLGKLSEAVGIFAGVELDLVLDAERGRFEVRHPPVEGTGLWLEDVLAYLQGRAAEARLWLDLKNVDQGNVAQAVDRLLELDRQFGLRERAIVETSFGGAGLERLSAAGFYLSHYLPQRPIRQALKAERSEALRQVAERIAAVVERQGARAISFGIGLYPFVRDHLGALVERQELDLLTWDLTLDSAHPSFARRLARRDRDRRLEVILVSFSSRFDI